MKIKLSIIIVSTFLLCSCTNSKILPKSVDIATNVYGGLIEISTKQELIEGELISVNENELIVLLLDSNKCISVPKKYINKYKLKYALGEAEKYSWTIPLFMLVSASHGYYMTLSLPFNFITTSTIYFSSANAYTLRSTYVDYEKLKMYARYPQGTPENIDISKIKFNY